MEIIQKYFPGLSREQINLIQRLQPLYAEWNARINVISRKDIDALYERHVLHSLAIAKFIRFRPGTKILDAGTGGGFPGIPLAVFFPETQFYLVDSIGKKIKVVNEIAASLGLPNVTGHQSRVELFDGKFDFVVSRAVTQLSEFMDWVQNKISQYQQNSVPNGILYLKGGNIDAEIRPFRKKAFVQDLSSYFEEDFFETKKLVYIPV